MVTDSERSANFKGKANHICASSETQNLQNLNENGKILLQDGYLLNTFCKNSEEIKRDRCTSFPSILKLTR